MNLKQSLTSRSAKDFFSLFFSNIFQKFLGLVREPVIAVFFGSGPLFTAYLMLRTGANLFSQFTVGNALKANLLPKFTKVYSSYKLVSLSRVSLFSRKSMLFLFIISQLVQSFIIIYLSSNPIIYEIQEELKLYLGINISYGDVILLFFLISILLSLSICFNFFNMVYLTIMQSKGKFFKYSVATTLNSLVVAILIIPFSLFFHVLGLVISRLIGILTLTISYILPMNKNTEGYEVDLNRKDINIPILILGNFANIIIVSSQLVAGLDNTGANSNITYFYYAVFILNAILTSVIGNVSTLLLKKISVQRNTKWLIYSLALSVFIGILMSIIFYFFSYEVIYIIYIGADYVITYFLDFFFNFSISSKFGIEEVLLTSKYLYQLSYSFIFIFISTILFQPFFSLPHRDTRRLRNIMSSIFIFVVFGGILILSFFDIDVKIKSLILIYCSSFVSVLLSIFSYKKYLSFV